MNDAVQPARLTVFVSYSVHDTSLVDTINGHLLPHARALFWGQDKVPGQDAWGTIYSWIDSADLVVVVLTGKTLSRALSVGNEVGYARKAGKRIIPLVGPEVPKGELGCLEGITYIRLDAEDPQRSISQLHDALARFAKEQETGRALALLGLVALGIIAFSK
ncbi:toll/interleukin-1 receptor domain-containing protein [Opitutus terrae]|uniref:TIR domain-containing protein n=1 Tax=Opitutus terrae (strain DSM 11246 / JCM 15787 / PB90-1) TaxID=452637 RepID=B1ZQ16_OPITP|nr:toll/interleukin-1 receptor domain-containing protein [Opitutus terrae]ACB77735.1 hypothetical protein Oter_4464 [Opitutus terrae PB90-1]